LLNHSITYRLTVNASTEHLAEVRKFVGNYAKQEGFSSEQITDTRLAVDEAFTNIIKHAYQNDESKTVHLELQFDAEKLCITLSDKGKSFDMTNYTFPDVKKQIKNKKRGGMGVYLIHHLMDEVVYRNKSQENVIIMCKHR